MMPLQDLPLSYPKFSWEAPNGAASQAQTLAAYEALRNQGLCREVSYLVWNDLADAVGALQQTLGEAGIHGDMTENSQTLTAERFNALRQSLDSLWNLPWSWEGSLGRRDMRGYARYGNAADWVMGSYILALSQRLNRLIGALQGEGTAVLTHKGLLQTLRQAAAQAAAAQLLASRAELFQGGVQNLHPARSWCNGSFADTRTLADQHILLAAASLQNHPAQLRWNARTCLLDGAAVLGREICALEARGKERLLPAEAAAGAYSGLPGTREAEYLASPQAEENWAAPSSASAGMADFFPLPADGIRFLEGSADSRSRASGTQEERTPIFAASRGGYLFRTQAGLHNAIAARSAARGKPETNIQAALHLQSQEGPWYPPELTEQGLYIRSVYAHTQQDGRLYLN